MNRGEFKLQYDRARVFIEESLEGCAPAGLLVPRGLMEIMAYSFGREGSA